MDEKHGTRENPGWMLTSATTIDEIREGLALRLLKIGDAALHEAVGLALRPSADHPGLNESDQVAQFLSDAANRSLAIGPVVVGNHREKLVASGLVLDSAGRSALAYISCPGSGTIELEVWIRVGLELVGLAFKRRNLLLEMLLEPDDFARARALPLVGFRKLTKLIYLRRSPSTSIVNSINMDGGEWMAYSDNSHPFFCNAVRQSYLQSMDCPELTNIRSIDDVVATHRCAGEFNPAYWQLFHNHGVPKGVILLSRIPAHPAFEVIYMGVVPEARGQGVGDALLNRAVELTSSTAGAGTSSTPQELVLAVDCRNVPARRLYARWGFRPVGERDAWIATPAETRG